MTRRSARAAARWAAGVALLPLALGCGRGDAGAPGGGATPSPTRPPEVTLTQADAGRSVSVARGGTVVVVVTDRWDFPGSHSVWSVTSGAPGVLRAAPLRLVPPTQAGTFPTGDHRVEAGFAAVAPGTATLTATEDRACEAMNPAFCHGDTFTVTVTVTG